MNYANNNPILGCSTDMKGLRTPAKELKKGNQLNASLVENDDTFSVLYDLWIKPWITYINDFDKEEINSNIFYENVRQEEYDKVFKKFKDVILTSSNDRVAIWQMCPVDAICKKIDEELSKIPMYMQFRIKIICMILSTKPEQAFAEGTNWASSFLVNNKEADFYEVSDGMIFPLKLEKGEENFCPRTLYNANDIPCSIQIQYQKKNGKQEDYSILLPAKSSLRVVFGNEKLEYLVSIKGNISFNPSDTRNAIFQQVEPEKSFLYMYMQKSNRWGRLETKGCFRDATINGDGGAIVLTNQGLYNTSRDELKKLEKLPMRIYGAGRVFARHYTDSSLESNVLKPTGQSFQNVIAVVENGESSLLIRDNDSAWECKHGIVKEVSDDVFVQCMLGRFLQAGMGERISSGLMTLGIKADGTKFAE